MLAIKALLWFEFDVQRWIGLERGLAMDGSAIVFTTGYSSWFAFGKKASRPDFVARFDLTFGAMPADGRYRNRAQKYRPCSSGRKIGM